jgi:HEPN domain-containing protein
VMLERADEFLTTAREALAKRHAGPAIDNALSAAELAVKAEVYLLGTPDKEGHHQRLDFWAKWVEQGNAPGHLAETFARLTDERGPARYADGPVGMDLGEIEVALAEVADMLAAVRGHTRRDVHDAAG